MHGPLHNVAPLGRPASALERMELTLLAGAGVLAAGLCVVAVRRAGRPRTVVWARLCGALVGLATRDLFRPRHRGGPRPTPRDRPANRSRAVADGGDGSGRSDDAARSSLVARLRRRVDGWLG